VEIEASVSERRADVLVTFPDERGVVGKGVAIEAQYRNKSKNLNSVADDYAEADFSTVVVRDSALDGLSVDLDAGEWWLSRRVQLRKKIPRETTYAHQDTGERTGVIVPVFVPIEPPGTTETVTVAGVDLRVQYQSSRYKFTVGAPSDRGCDMDAWQRHDQFVQALRRLLGSLRVVGRYKDQVDATKSFIVQTRFDLGHVEGLVLEKEGLTYCGFTPKDETQSICTYLENTPDTRAAIQRLIDTAVEMREYNEEPTTLLT
jgi:hypothetical protein